MAAQLMGPRAEFVFDHAMVKPAQGLPTAWHQDQAFWRAGMPFRVISFWIALQEVNRDNGCLKFIPKSNHGPLYEHRSLGDDPRKHGLEAVGVTGEAAVFCPIPAGGATIHHWLTCHGADANRTTSPRRAYALCFGVLADRPLVTREYPWNRRKVTERAKRYRASLKPWHRMKEEVRFRLTRMGLL
jgi:ectoine hydroxylase-related dioxygenase (phytanoyl-CoA dioxygenase family)